MRTKRTKTEVFYWIQKKKKKTSVDKKITYTLHYKRTSRRQFKII